MRRFTTPLPAGMPARMLARLLARLLAATLAISLGACADAPAGPTGGAPLAIAAQREAGHRHDARPAADLAAVRWNAVTRDLVIRYRTDPSARPYALVSLAQYAAATRAHDRRMRGERADPHVAVATASATVLAYLYPLEAMTLAQRASEERPDDVGDRDDASAGDRAARGEAVGREAGESVIAIAKADGLDAPYTGTIPVGPGLWIPNGKPTTPMLGQMRPLLLRSPSQYRPAPPPTFGSPAFLAALGEVRAVSDARTTAQADLARTWALSGGTHRTQGHWNVIAVALLAAHEVRDERTAAHVLAVLNAAMNDASIACFDAKYTYYLIRPSQADPGITLVVGLPNHPSYPSSHSCTSGAGAAVLGAFFRAEGASLGATADEIGLSRLYAGIHYRFDIDTGLALGERVARLALRRDRRGGLLRAIGL